MPSSNEKKKVKGRRSNASVSNPAPEANKTNVTAKEESASDIDGAKKKGDKKDQNEMSNIEELCQQFGIPEPSELYIIPRDFEISGKPNLTQFDMRMPEGLARWIDEAEFEYTVGKINYYFAKAEQIDCRTIWNGVCKFLTCFMIRACHRTRSERAIIRVRNFILQQNQDVYHPKGFHIVEPAARGLRHLEFRSITYYSMKYFLEHEENIPITESEMHIGHKPTNANVTTRRSVK